MNDSTQQEWQEEKLEAAIDEVFCRHSGVDEDYSNRDPSSGVSRAFQAWVEKNCKGGFFDSNFVSEIAHRSVYVSNIRKSEDFDRSDRALLGLCDVMERIFNGRKGSNNCFAAVHWPSVLAPVMDGMKAEMLSRESTADLMEAVLADDRKNWICSKCNR